MIDALQNTRNATKKDENPQNKNMYLSNFISLNKLVCITSCFFVVPLSVIQCFPKGKSRDCVISGDVDRDIS